MNSWQPIGGHVKKGDGLEPLAAPFSEALPAQRERLREGISALELDALEQWALLSYSKIFKRTLK